MTLKDGIGVSAGKYGSVNHRSTCIGYDARNSTTTDYSYSMALGNAARITATYQVRVGNTSVTSIGGYEPWTDLSDKRFKKNISDKVVGLNFIMKLRPVTYNLDIDKLDDFLNVPDSSRDIEGVRIKEAMLKTGFLAQEVEQASIECGIEFSGVDKPKNENDHYGLRYSIFVVPLVKAVQEQQKIIEAQGEFLKELKAEIQLLRGNTDL
ncbi:MAG: hypothetical protein COB15_05365 [Flavobacteriales bacterium]|nr:MAG: hypothetical protein COB15_05365 [Flavobacteriales bacterium]